MSSNRGVINMTNLRGVVISLSGKLLGDTLDMLSAAVVATQEQHQRSFLEKRDSAAAFWRKELARYECCVADIYALIRKEKRSNHEPRS